MPMLSAMSLLTTATMLSGCVAPNVGVVPMGGDNYSVSRQSMQNLSGTQELKTEAMAEAHAFCANQQKKVQVVATHETGAPLMPGNFPKARIHFICVADERAGKADNP